MTGLLGDLLSPFAAAILYPGRELTTMDSRRLGDGVIMTKTEVTMKKLILGALVLALALPLSAATFKDVALMDAACATHKEKTDAPDAHTKARLMRSAGKGGVGANGLALAAAFSAAAIVILGIAVAVRGRMSAPGMLFGAITLAIGGWLGSFALMYASRSAEAALFWARAGNFAAALIAPAIFHF